MIPMLPMPYGVHGLIYFLERIGVRAPISDGFLPRHHVARCPGAGEFGHLRNDVLPPAVLRVDDLLYRVVEVVQFYRLGLVLCPPSDEQLGYALSVRVAG